MDNFNINQCLINGELRVGVLPHVDNLKNQHFVFEFDFGLPRLPDEPGVILVRGARQYGKSTWLEQQIAITIKEFGKGTALYLNGDEIKDDKELLAEIKILVNLFSKSKIKRLFIDEITAIRDWVKAIKRLIDAGDLKDILLVTTGSKATDLRRGVERLPGRKGKLSRTNYIFTPISYTNFKNICGDFFKTDTLSAYLLSGGSPLAANALADTGRLPEYVVQTINDWVFGEFAASGRSRSHLIGIIQSLYRMACNPIGQAKLARESGLTNNTVAQGYIELLSDLMIVIPAFPYDTERNISLFRKQCKYHFTNLLMAICWHPKKPRTIIELNHLGEEELGSIFEWAVAQEIWRKLCISDSEDILQHLNFWQSKKHEVDFVIPSKQLYIEVKAGKTGPMDFIWFVKCFQHTELTVISKNTFETDKIKGVSLENFLLTSQI